MNELNEYGKLLLKTLEHLRVISAMERYPVATKLKRLDQLIELLRSDGMHEGYLTDYGYLIYESLTTYQKDLRQEPFNMRNAIAKQEIDMCSRMIRLIPQAFRS